VTAPANRVGLLAWTAALLLVAVLALERFTAAQAENRWVQHSDQVLSDIKDLQIAMRDSRDAERSYLLTDEKRFLDTYGRATASVVLLQGELSGLTADNEGQQASLQQLSPLVQHRLQAMAETLQLRRDAGTERALAALREDINLGEGHAVYQLLRAMAAEEERLLAHRRHLALQRGIAFAALALVGGLVAVLALGWAAYQLAAAWREAEQASRQQRTMSERLQTCLDSLSQGVAVFDYDRLLTNWNACFLELLGLPRSLLSGGFSYGSLARHLAAADDRPDLLETDDQLRLALLHHPRDSVVYERTASTGHVFEISRRPMPRGGFVLTVSDMTKRLQAEAVLREAQKMQAIGQLTGGIAHDFNNLLTVILGNLEFVQRRLEPESPMQTRIGRAIWASQRGATLTSQLLAFARKQPLAPSPIDLAQTVPDLVPLLSRTLGETIEVRLVGTAGLWPAMADAAQLESALLNLALNARDAMPGGGRLTIELANKVLDADYALGHAEVTPGDYVMLAVSDTGHGMTPDIVQRVFEPFFTTKPDGKGTGLGLAMVFGFVKQSKGHIKIYSEPGEGTSVKMYLPRAIGVSGLAPARTLAPAELAAANATLLVVEDEPGVRDITVAILRDYGYRVLEAADGEEALRVFAEHGSEIGLLLTDVVLPGKLRGRDIAQRVTAERPEIRVLFMSGYTENSIVHHGRLDDGVFLISKPFKREQLATRVAEVLASGRAPEAPAPPAGGNVVPIKSSRGE